LGHIKCSIKRQTPFQASSDCDLWFPTFRSIRYRLRSKETSKTFVYRFDADTENNFNSAGTQATALYRYPTHGDDANHIFKTIRHKKLEEMSVEASKVLHLMVTSFTNFAKTGNPSVEEFNVTWPAVSSESNLLRGLNIHENESSVMDFPESRRIGVFDEIWAMERSGAEKLMAKLILVMSIAAFMIK
jgi:carboxylesterase type B